jgi:hypothetical protein
MPRLGRQFNLEEDFVVFSEAGNQFPRELRRRDRVQLSAVLVFDFRGAFGDRTRRQCDFLQMLKTLGKKILS